MKKLLIILGSLFGLVILALILLPIIFKDEIKAEIDNQIAQNVNANVYYNADEFGISFFSNFPNLSVELGHFGVVGKDIFETDTLVAMDKFEIALDPLKILLEGEVEIQKIELNYIEYINTSAVPMFTWVKE